MSAGWTPREFPERPLSRMFGGIDAQSSASSITTRSDVAVDMTDSSLADRIRAAVALLFPEEMTPTAKRVFESILESRAAVVDVEAGETP